MEDASLGVFCALHSVVEKKTGVGPRISLGSCVLSYYQVLYVYYYCCSTCYAVGVVIGGALFRSSTHGPKYPTTSNAATCTHSYKRVRVSFTAN